MNNHDNTKHLLIHNPDDRWKRFTVVKGLVDPYLILAFISQNTVCQFRGVYKCIFIIYFPCNSVKY